MSTYTTALQALAGCVVVLGRAFGFGFRAQAKRRPNLIVDMLEKPQTPNPKP